MRRNSEFSVVGRFKHALITAEGGRTAIANITEASQKRMVLDIVGWFDDYDEAFTTLQIASDEGRVNLRNAHKARQQHHERGTDEDGVGDDGPILGTVVGLVRRYIPRLSSVPMGSVSAQPSVGTGQGASDPGEDASMGPV